MANYIKNILVVDDSEYFRNFFTKILEDFRFTVHLAADGLAGIEILKRDAIDLIITDFRMPFCNGIELLQWCRQRALYIPVIFTTAESELFEAEELALGDCCATLIRKPVDIELLLNALDAAEHLDHHRDCVHGGLHSLVDSGLQERSSRSVSFESN